MKKAWIHFVFLTGVWAAVQGAPLIAVPRAEISAQTESALTTDASLVNTSAALTRLAEKVVERTLPNGLHVIMYHRGEAPVFSGALVVRVGGTDEVTGITGISHLFEHMAFKGTPRVGVTDPEQERVLLAQLEVLAQKQRDDELNAIEKAEWDRITGELRKLWIPDQFTREYERRGATGMNASTDTEFTKYFVSLPRDEFDFWLRMESDRLREPVLRQFYQERDVVREERRMRYEDDPGGKLYELLLSTAFRTHPYHNPVIGYPFDVSRLTASMLEAFRKIYYVPNNMALAIVGDVHPEVDLPLIEKYFGTIPPGKAPPRPRATESVQQGERHVVLQDRGSPQLMVGYHKPSHPNPDDPPLSVMAEMFAGSRVAPLFRELVVRQRIAASVDHTEAPGNLYPNLLIFELVPRAPHSNSEVLRAFDQTVEQFLKSGISEQSLVIAKRAIATSFLTELNSNMSLALNFATAQAGYKDWRESINWYNKAMEVTLEDVRRVAVQYLVETNRTVAELKVVAGKDGQRGGKTR